MVTSVILLDSILLDLFPSPSLAPPPLLPVVVPRDRIYNSQRRGRDIGAACASGSSLLLMRYSCS